jgi:hypothetical protein
MPPFAFPTLTPLVVLGLYVAEEPSKMDCMATQINTVMERLDELVDQTLVHHHTQTKGAIEVLSKSFSIKAGKIVARFSDYIKLMGNYVIQMEIQHHKAVLDDFAHIGFHIVQTQALVGMLHEHMHKAMVVVLAGFHAMAKDNKTCDEQFKAGLDFGLFDQIEC